MNVYLLDKCRALWGEPELILSALNVNSCNQLLNTACRCGLWWCECTMHVAVIDNEVICTDVSENMVCCEVLQWL